nr:transposase [Microbacterium bovistercoris]
MSEPPLEQIAAALYAGPLDAFVAQRNARAKQAGERDAAEEIRALRKPSVAAWVVNVFARERRDELAQALRLADELREAQEELDATALASLGRQRRALTARLAQEAAALATARGARVTASTIEAVQQTIAAAFFNAEAAIAVASGRLIRELEPSADGPADIEDAVGGGLGAPSPATAPPPVDEVKVRRERRAAERAVHDAEQHVSRAQRELDKAERGLSTATRRREQLGERERELQAELVDVQARLQTARADVVDADEQHAAAELAAEKASRALETARGALARLEGSSGETQ